MSLPPLTPASACDNACSTVLILSDRPGAVCSMRPAAAMVEMLLRALRRASPRGALEPFGRRHFALRFPRAALSVEDVGQNEMAEGRDLRIRL